MTDNDIIKALECCIKANSHGDCVRSKCPALLGNECYYATIVTDAYDDNEINRAQMKDVVALINRQKAEIERLKKTEYILPARHCGKTRMVRVKLDEIRAEAIKEFAERLKEELANNLGCPITDTPRIIIDNLVKEMVGDKKCQV